MLSEKELEAAIAAITERLRGVNLLFIRKVAAQIAKIGELGPSSAHRLLTMMDLGADVLEINTALREATGLNTQTLFALYRKALDAVYTDRRFAAIMRSTRTPVAAETARQRLNAYAQRVAVQSAQTMQNLSNTTAVSAAYQQAVDRAVLAVSSGLTDYRSAAREIIRDMGYNGLQVVYASGYHRRLDTAVRQNIIDATNQIAQEGSLMMGDALGYDAVEISAHPNSAPDHEPVQGRVFLRSEFDKMQAGQDFVDVDGKRYSGFARPIGEWNCGHIAMAFSTEYSIRRYTPEQLEEWRKANAAGCEFGGRHYTRYEADQKMRALETSVRRLKDAANAARVNDDMDERRELQEKINRISARYGKLAEAAGLPTRRDRMRVEGFQMVKV